MSVTVHRAAVQKPRVRVNIRNIAVGGAGVGEVVSQVNGGSDLLGITAFVPYTAPGELVIADVVEQKDRYLSAELVEIEHPSEFRVKPRCPVYMQCGGCELQHMAYDAQLRAKHEMIRTGLRAAKLGQAVIDSVFPVHPSDSYEYRRRISLHIDARGNVGFYRTGSRVVVPIADCPIAVPSLRELLPSVAKLGSAVQGKISSLLLEADDTGVVAVLKAPYDLTIAERKFVLDVARSHFQNAVVMVGDKEVSGFGRGVLDLPLGPGNSLTVRVPAGGFSQVNSAINQVLVGAAVESARAANTTRALDLYAGAGNFSLPLARSGIRVTAVESVPSLVTLGRQSAERLGITKFLDFRQSSVEKFLSEDARKIDAQTAIADPPRSGLGRMVPVISAVSSLKTMLLVSCHLPSFFRDVRNLVEAGWNVERIAPFDMFAQTSYVEVLTVLRRS